MRLALRPVSMPSRTRSSEAMTRRLAVLALGLLPVFSTAGRAADPVGDLLAGRTKECPKCELAGANLKRLDLSGADLPGANLAGANLHRANLAGANLAGAEMHAFAPRRDRHRRCRRLAAWRRSDGWRPSSLRRDRR